MASGTVHRLIPDRERATRRDAATASAIIAGLNLPPYVRERLRNELARLSQPDAERTLFRMTMLSVQQGAAIWEAIRALPAKDRPQEVRHAFDLCLLHLRQDTGEIMLTRDEFAERMKIDPKHVSSAMGVLARMGVVIKERRKVAGMRGPGIVAWFINPHVAWNGALNIRAQEAERQEPPLLKLMQGGKD